MRRRHQDVLLWHIEFAGDLRRGLGVGLVRTDKTEVGTDQYRAGVAIVQDNRPDVEVIVLEFGRRNLAVRIGHRRDVDFGGSRPELPGLCNARENDTGGRCQQNPQRTCRNFHLSPFQ